MNMNRKEFLKSMAGGAVALAGGGCAGLPVSRNRPKLAVSAATYMVRGRLKANASPAGFRDSLHLLEHAHELGAGGAQIGVRDWSEPGMAKRLRGKAEEFGMTLEGQIALPKKDADIAAFERSLTAAKEAGVSILRTVMLGGRRYETFGTRESWEQFRRDSWEWLTRAEPLVKKHGLRLAVENHKDWRIDEMKAVMRRISSEHVGVNLDMGNNIALLEDPMRVVRELAPWTISAHIKDMGVAEYSDGFLLAEVPFGYGFLDVREMVRICLRANPSIQFNLEMITRDPLEIPCLTSQYWETWSKPDGEALSSMLDQVRRNSGKKELPRIKGMNKVAQVRFEEENNQRCFAWWNEQMLRT
jgi:sugar phosphate isomerase/epimerase